MLKDPKGTTRHEHSLKSLLTKGKQAVQAGGSLAAGLHEDGGGKAQDVYMDKQKNM